MAARDPGRRPALARGGAGRTPDAAGSGAETPGRGTGNTPDGFRAVEAPGEARAPVLSRGGTRASAEVSVAALPQNSHAGGVFRPPRQGRAVAGGSGTLLARRDTPEEPLASARRRRRLGHGRNAEAGTPEGPRAGTRTEAIPETGPFVE